MYSRGITTVVAFAFSCVTCVTWNRGIVLEQGALQKHCIAHVCGSLPLSFARSVIMSVHLDVEKSGQPLSTT
jgi:hypothetical protein